jgi:hypothetical protein
LKPGVQEGRAWISPEIWKFITLHGIVTDTDNLSALMYFEESLVGVRGSAVVIETVKR